MPSYALERLAHACVPRHLWTMVSSDISYYPGKCLQISLAGSGFISSDPLLRLFGDCNGGKKLSSAGSLHGVAKARENRLF